LQGPCNRFVVSLRESHLFELGLSHTVSGLRNRFGHDRIN
jgi:hypothetical protein